MNILGPREQKLITPRHDTAYLISGPETGPLIFFLHGWPETSVCWRKQLDAFARLGFCAVAPDMRGYGGSEIHSTHCDYAIEELVQDMIELIDHFGADKAVWFGHDWGSSVVWALAKHHPDRCHAIANFCVPYHPDGAGPSLAIELADRTIYPEDRYPAAQWDYQLYYRDNFDAVVAAFEENIRGTIRSIYRAGMKEHVGRRSPTASVTEDRGWFGGAGRAPELDRDDRVLSAYEEKVLVSAFQKSGFSGPGSWYMNEAQNADYFAAAKTPEIDLPTLFVHAAYDLVCETLNSKLADPMRRNCRNLTEAQLDCGHWVTYERPEEVNAILVAWLAAAVPGLWPKLKKEAA